MIHVNYKGRRYIVKLYRLIPIIIIIALFIVTALSMRFIVIQTDNSVKSDKLEPTIEVNTSDRDKTYTQPVAEVTSVEPSEEIKPQVMKPDELPQHLYDLVISECAANDIPAEFVLAIMKTETQSFNTDAVNYNTNGTYDSGIMQINSSNISWMADKFNCPEFANNPKDATANITVGIRYLASIYTAYKQHYGNDMTKCILATAGAYNRGVGNQNKYKNIYQYNARVFAHYCNIVNGIDTNIDYSKEMPAIIDYLKTQVIL